LRLSLALALLLAACGAPAPSAVAPTAAPAAATTVAQVSATVAAVAPTVAAAAPTVAAATGPTVAAAAKPAATALAQAAPTVAAAVGTALPKVVASTAPVTVNFWHGMNGTDPGTQGGTLRQLVDQYKQVAPNVTINLDFTPYTANELQEKVTASIAANNMPDMVQAFESDVAAWHRAGAIVPLDEFMKASLTPADLDDIQKALLDSGRFPQYENKQLSFPFNRSIYVLYFNKPELAKAGFPNGPKTWDDMDSACTKIMADGMPCYAIQPSADSFVPVVWGRGGEVISADFKKALFNGPEGVAALTFDVNNVKAKKAYVSKGFDWQNDFGSKKVAMSPITTIAGDPFIAKAVNDQFEIGIAPVPTAAGKPVKSLFSGTNLAVMKSSPEKEQAAWNFIKWLTETKQSAFWTVQTTYLPVRKSALNDPSLKEFIAKTPRFQVALDMIPTGFAGISVAGWADGRTYLLDAITSADTLVAEPKPALDDAARKTDEALARD
jgi:ABC-type glycerol-3-phosphate transport system substrate-binding protein